MAPRNYLAPPAPPSAGGGPSSQSGAEGQTGIPCGLLPGTRGHGGGFPPGESTNPPSRITNPSFGNLVACVDPYKLPALAIIESPADQGLALRNHFEALIAVSCQAQGAS
jgi:hypothetical protein